MLALSQTVRLIALAALLLRAVLPVGWMPDAQAGLVICGAATPGMHVPMAMAHMDMAGMDMGQMAMAPHDEGSGLSHSDHQSHPDKDQHHQDCSFAHSGQVVAPPFAGNVAPPALHVFAAATGAARAVAATSARFSPNSPRAPPLDA